MALLLAVLTQWWCACFAASLLTPLALVGNAVKRGQSTMSADQVTGTTGLAVGRTDGVVWCVRW